MRAGRISSFMIKKTNNRVSSGQYRMVWLPIKLVGNRASMKGCLQRPSCCIQLPVWGCVDIGLVLTVKVEENVRYMEAFPIANHAKGSELFISAYLINRRPMQASVAARSMPVIVTQSYIKQPRIWIAALTRSYLSDLYVSSKSSNLRGHD